MPHVQTDHPDAERLTAFGLGKLNDADMAAIETHVAECETCCDRIKTTPPDPFVGLLRNGRAGRSYELPTIELPKSRLPSLAQAPDGLAEHPRYQIVALLGAGGMGEVYKAQHRLMDRFVALKVIRREVLENPTAIERFRREVKAAARLSHQHIVASYDAEQAGDCHFLVMEFVDGISLAQLVRDRGTLPVAEACKYVRQAALGLEHAFEHGMVHRDIKPQNVMVDRNGEVKVLDFGLAHLFGDGPCQGPLGSESGRPQDPSLTFNGVLMGTPDYIAPEQAADPRAADIRSDIYGLGCTLYYLLAGAPPFAEGTVEAKLAAHRDLSPPSLATLRKNVPPGLLRVLDRMLAKDPSDRYQTPAEVAEALRPFAQQPGRWARLWRPAVAAAVLLAVAGFGWLYGPQVYRFAMDKGELVIETSDPAVEVVVTGGGKTIRIHDPESEQTVTLEAGHYEIELAPGEKGLRLSVSEFTLKRGGKEIVRVWHERKAPEPPALKQTRLFAAHAGQARAADFNRDGRWAVSGGHDGVIRVWDLTAGQELRKIVTKVGPVSTVYFSPDNRRILSTIGSSIFLWDAETGQQIRVFEGHTDSVRQAVFSPDGTQVLSGGAGADPTLRLWNAETGEEIRRFEGHEDIVWSVAFSPDGSRALSGSWDKTLRLWDVSTGQEIKRMTGHSDFLLGVAFTSDGAKAVSSSRDKTARLWDLLSGQELGRFEGHEGHVEAVAVSPDGRWVATGGYDHHIRLWDLETRRQVARQYSGAVFSLDFAPAGDRLISAGEDGSVRLWQLPETEELADSAQETQTDEASARKGKE